MHTVEIRLSRIDVAARIEEMRRWLDARGGKSHKFTSTGSSNETVVLIEFEFDADAADFARHFSGSIVPS